MLQELREVNLDHRGCWRMHVLFYGRWGPVSRAVRLDDQDSGKAVVELRVWGALRFIVEGLNWFKLLEGEIFSGFDDVSDHHRR